jgi:hypothetical protein
MNLDVSLNPNAMLGAQAGGATPASADDFTRRI